jgi:PAS domain-containing protein
MSEKEMDFTDDRNLRRKAEEKLKEDAKKGYIPEEEHDKERLLHELQVHQIELEMQNEELQQAYERAEEALKKYTILYDFAPTGYFTLDAEGTICELNFTGAELLGDKRISLIGSNFKLFIHRDSMAAFNQFFSKVFTANAKESCQLWLGYDDKPLHFVYIEGVVIEDDQQCLFSVIDVTNFRKNP